MLYGLWRQDLIERLTQQIGTIRREAWGEPDLSSNVAASACVAVATQYDRGVCVEHAAGESVEPLLEEIEATGIWSAKQRYQRDLVGMREMLTAIDVDELGIHYRQVFPDMLQASSDPRRPSVPTETRETILLPNGTWAYDVWNADGFECISARDGVVLERRGPWVYADGRPFLPSVLDHASRGGALWDAFDQIELWDGALNAAVLWTYFGHIMRDASWPQRWALNVEPAGLNTEGTDAGKRQAVTTDPAGLLIRKMIDGLADNAQPQIGQWSNSADPMSILEACGAYERRVSARAGLSPADVSRVSGDPRSGYALAITREGQREQQRRFEPILRPGDEELIGKTAAMVNRFRGTSYPESGYRITYDSIPASAEEIAEGRAQSDWEAAQGLASPISVYARLHPGTEPDEAANAIVALRLEAMALEQRVLAEATALGLSKPQAEQVKLVGIVDIARQIFVDPAMTPEQKRVALVAFGGLDDATADRLVATLDPKATPVAPAPNVTPPAKPDAEPEDDAPEDGA